MIRILQPIIIVVLGVLSFYCTESKSLLKTSEKGQIIALKQLLLEKTDPNVQNQKGETPLILATKSQWNDSSDGSGQLWSVRNIQSSFRKRSQSQSDRQIRTKYRIICDSIWPIQNSIVIE